MFGRSPTATFLGTLAESGLKHHPAKVKSPQGDHRFESYMFRMKCKEHFLRHSMDDDNTFRATCMFCGHFILIDLSKDVDETGVSQPT
jgi:hypothetical protein